MATERAKNPANSAGEVVAPLRSKRLAPASAIQQHLWAQNELAPLDSANIITAQFALTGALDFEFLVRALNEIRKRHEILRTNFVKSEGKVRQVVRAYRDLEVPVTDLRNLPHVEWMRRAERLASAREWTTFDLRSDLLIRTRLLRIDDNHHRLLVNVHRIVADNWSMGIFAAELGVLYGGYCGNTTPTLADLRIQYSDYTNWLEEHQQAAARSEAYWKQQLSTLKTLELPADFPRPIHDRQGKTGTITRLLPGTLINSLRQLSGTLHATLFMTVLAAVKVLLHRYTGETDIAVGAPAMGRHIEEAEPLIGPFTNTIVLRSDLSGNPEFVELLGHVRDTVINALEHQRVPPEPVSVLLYPECVGQGGALFRVRFSFQRDLVKSWNHGGLELRPIPSQSPSAANDLNLSMEDQASGWSLTCEYNTLLFRPQRIIRMLEHLENLLTSIAADPGVRVSRVSFLSREERTDLVDVWNDTALDYPSTCGVQRFIEAQADRTPDATAIVCGKTRLTYKALNERANQMARVFEKKSVQPGSVVGICVDRSPEMIAALIAIWKAGCAYLSLDPSFPPARLALMAEDANIQLLITSQALSGSISTTAPMVMVDRDWAEIESQDKSSLPDSTTGKSTACVFYTSGSTGKPKGVLIPHSALSNLLWAVVREPGISDQDVIAAITTASFDIATVELFAPLLVGARVILLSRNQASDGVALRNEIFLNKVTILQGTPATWRMLIYAGWKETPTLKMLSGGEPLPRDLADELLKRGGELWNMYGPTETTIYSSWVKIENDGAPISIGRPAPNTQFYVLDPNLELVPAGVPGELFIGGAGVAKGYLNRAELTAERFIANPFGSGRIYRTGDRARFRLDGEVELLGRLDRQVKVRGYRVELGEVEAALTALTDLSDAAVIVRPDGSGELGLVGYYVPSHSRVTHKSIREQLKRSLPDYMVPGLLFALEQLPKTPTHKTDRNALRDLEPRRPAAAYDSTVPRSGGGGADALEATLISIWERTLGVGTIDRNDDLFELGTNSVLVAQAFGQMETLLGKAVPLATLFHAPTIAKLAELMLDGEWTPPWSVLVPIRPHGSKPSLYLIHSIGGNILNMAGFAFHLGVEYPLYGLQAKGLDGKETPHFSIEAMAADYIERIKSLQPEGPYLLCGFSAGGIVAYEMARQLSARGEVVPVLILLDTSIQLPLKSAKIAERWERWLERLRFNVLYAFRIGWRRFSAVKVRNWSMRANIRRWKMGRISALNVEEAFLFAVRNYVPGAYSGRAVLFRALDDLDSHTERSGGWAALMGRRLSVRLAGGNHDSMLSEPHVESLAREIGSCLLESLHFRTQGDAENGRTDPA